MCLGQEMRAPQGTVRKAKTLEEAIRKAIETEGAVLITRANHFGSDDAPHEPHRRLSRSGAFRNQCARRPGGLT